MIKYQNLNAVMRLTCPRMGCTNDGKDNCTQTDGTR